MGGAVNPSFARHVLEMVLSMAIPMVVLAGTFWIALPAAGLEGFRPGAGTAAGVLAVAAAVALMTTPMIALMRRRGHPWREAGEMTLAMFAPLVLLAPLLRIALPRWGIAVGPSVMVPVALVAMTLPMVLLMLWRRDRYDHAKGEARHTHR